MLFKIGDKVNHSINDNLRNGTVFRLFKSDPETWDIKWPSVGTMPAAASRLTLILPKQTPKQKAKHDAEGKGWLTEGHPPYKGQRWVPNRDPEADKRIIALGLQGKVIVHSHPITLEETAAEVAEALGITVEDGKKLVIAAPNQHGAKYDLVVKNIPELKNLQHKLKIFFNPEGYTNDYTEVQIGSKELCLMVLKAKN